MKHVIVKHCVYFHLLSVPVPCSDGDIRLANETFGDIDGNYYLGGRVQVCYNEEYHPVCGQGWDDLEAAVICNSIGYSTYRMCILCCLK